MELLGWKPEDVSPKLDGAIERHVIKKTDKRKSPVDGALVQGLQLTIFNFCFNTIIIETI